jgi:hypothetical protein
MMLSTSSKVTAEHLRRHAYLYVRQSSLQQVHEHRESTARQYDLKGRAQALGWVAEQIVVIDEDLGLSGARRPWSGMGFNGSWRTSGSGGWASLWAWRSRGWRGIPAIGIGCWRSARWPRRSFSTRTGCRSRPFKRSVAVGAQGHHE